MYFNHFLCTPCKYIPLQGTPENPSFALRIMWLAWGFRGFVAAFPLVGRMHQNWQGDPHLCMPSGMDWGWKRLLRDQPLPAAQCWRLPPQCDLLVCRPWAGRCDEVDGKEETRFLQWISFFPLNTEVLWLELTAAL